MSFRKPSALRSEWNRLFQRSREVRFLYGYTDVGDVLGRPAHPDDPGFADWEADGSGSEGWDRGRTALLAREILQRCNETGKAITASTPPPAGNP